MVWQSDRQMIRVFVGLASLMWAGLELWALSSHIPPGISYFSVIVVQVLSTSPYIFPALFITQGTAAIYAIIADCRHPALIVVESMLACFLWGGIAVFNVVTFDPVSMPPGTVSLSLVMFFITLWLLMRANYAN